MLIDLPDFVYPQHMFCLRNIKKQLHTLIWGACVFGRISKIFKERYDNDNLILITFDYLFSYVKY